MKKAMSIERLVVATHNKGKLQEFVGLLDPFFENIVSAGELGLPEPEETGSTFIDNALLKARAAAKSSQAVALADDSGLCVSALDGQPGIYSARWGGPTKDSVVAMQRVHQEIGENPDRSAYFVCVLALVWPDGKHELFEGRVDGNIVWPPQGTQGHGYDPVFVPKGETRSFAEMTSEEKHVISHRGHAVRQLLAFLSKV